MVSIKATAPFTKMRGTFSIEVCGFCFSMAKTGRAHRRAITTGQTNIRYLAPLTAVQLREKIGVHIFINEETFLLGFGVQRLNFG
jgi:hypothetical protein